MIASRTLDDCKPLHVGVGVFEVASGAEPRVVGRVAHGVLLRCAGRLYRTDREMSGALIFAGFSGARARDRGRGGGSVCRESLQYGCSVMRLTTIGQAPSCQSMAPRLRPNQTSCSRTSA